MNSKDLSITKADRPLVAVMAALASALMFSFGDAIVKLVSLELSLWQILVLRSLLSIPALIMICRLRTYAIKVGPDALFWTTARSALMVLMWVSYYAALVTLPVSVAASVYFTMPIFVTLISSIYPGDRIGAAGWFGVAVGFCGMLLIVKPDGGSFNHFIILPLFAAICFAVSIVITRTRLRHEHPFAMAVNLHLGFLLTGLIATAMVYVTGDLHNTQLGTFFGGPWQPLGTREWIVIVILAVVVTAGNLTTSIAYQLGQSSTVATFSFAYIPFVGIWGFIFFGEVPDLITVSGILMIIFAGSMVLRQPVR